MKQLLWDFFKPEEQNKYLKRLQILGMISGLFKELEGEHGRKPYLHYRNHEILYCKTFDVMSIARSDSAFDAIVRVAGKTFGVGLKTWMYNNDYSNQKVAEFNRKSNELRALLNLNKHDELVDKIAQLRNERIQDDKRRYLTDKDIYHIIVRDLDCFHVLETEYKAINRKAISNISKTNSSIQFCDGENNYSFNISKTTLFKRFDVSQSKRILTYPVKILDNPLSLFDDLYSLFDGKIEKNQQKSYILLPLYNDKTLEVNEKSVFNASLASPKNKGSDTPRPDYEAYAPIPIYVHHLYPKFFGIDALNREERKNHKIKLYLPNNQQIDAKITQDNGKGLQTSPQSVLGKWLLFDLFGLPPRAPLTRELIDEKEIDCIKITKINDKEFLLDAGSYGEYEKWKLSHKNQIETLRNKGIISRMPEFRIQYGDYYDD